MTRWLLLAVLLLPSASAQSPADTLVSPWTLARPTPGESFWAPLLRLRGAEAAYRASPTWWPAYAQYRAQSEAAAGRHDLALAFWDAPASGRDSVGVLPAGARAVDAAAWIASAADTVQVVMINERHHAASDRLLTLRLLPLLYERGYRYLAAEALSHDDDSLNARPYPVASTGYYTGEPVFAEVLREARRLGFTLVSYEIRDDQRGADTTRTPQQQRDASQARNLIDSVFAHDPDARVLVHAGFAHVYETATPDWSPMAHYLREFSGLDPLTIDQTALSERSAPAYEHPAYRAADAAGWLSEAPVVLLDPANRPVALTDLAVDVQVFAPRTRVEAGRPTWMAMDGRRAVDLSVPGCAALWCGVEVRLDGEPADAIPVDRVEVDHRDRVRVFVPVGAPATAEVRDAAGEIVHTLRID